MVLYLQMFIIRCATLTVAEATTSHKVPWLETEGDWPEGKRPPYAILSHTWAQHGEPAEVVYSDYLANKAVTEGKDWDKIDKAIQMTKTGRDALNYLWIDTCCIDKDSSTELNESINSMFKWYMEATVCYVYLADFSRQGGVASKSTYDKAKAADMQRAEDLKVQLEKCRWFFRGWTLQELIAPSRVEFFDTDWQFLGSRQDLHSTIASITKIDDLLLADPPNIQQIRNVDHLLRIIPVARKMSWAAARSTTRPEDMAYSLLGIFGINMPLLYGEGDKAFLRLQEEIMKYHNDLSLFAWECLSSYKPVWGILAESPKEFANAGSIKFGDERKHNPEFSVTNKGLKITARIQTAMSKNTFGLPMKLPPGITIDNPPDRKATYFDLGCYKEGHLEEQMCSIELGQVYPGQYARVNCDMLSRGRASRRLSRKKMLYISTTLGSVQEALMSSTLTYGRSILFKVVGEQCIEWENFFPQELWVTESGAFVFNHHGGLSCSVGFQTRDSLDIPCTKFSITFRIDDFNNPDLLGNHIIGGKIKIFLSNRHRPRRGKAIRCSFDVPIFADDDTIRNRKLRLTATYDGSENTVLAGLQVLQINVRAAVHNNTGVAGRLKRLASLVTSPKKR